MWLAVTGQSSCLAEQPARERPSIVFFLADNWRWPHASIFGDSMASTPTFDRIAREGILFNFAFNPVPSCSPTRACILTGKVAHQLGERASLWSSFAKDTPVITDLLRDAGYEVGYSGKGWAPGNFDVSGWSENPVGKKYDSFQTFIAKRDPRKPFFFWIGNTDTATKGGKHPFLTEAEKSWKVSDVKVPPELPDCEEVRRDILNYYGGIHSMEREAAAMMRTLEQSKLLDQTAIIYASDNGWQMPRGLANCYDSGSRVPLAIRWAGKIRAGQRSDAMINIGELGPTFLAMANIDLPSEMTLNSLLPLCVGEEGPAKRDAIFIERERHANVRKGDLSYPMRAVRTREFLYVRNLRPDRWPAGDPDVFFLHERPYGDVDTTHVKDYLLKNYQNPMLKTFVSSIFERRPREELYDLRSDPAQLKNVASNQVYKKELASLRARLDDWMKSTDDPRVDPAYDQWDHFPYYGKAPKAN